MAWNWKLSTGSNPCYDSLTIGFSYFLVIIYKLIACFLSKTSLIYIKFICNIKVIYKLKVYITVFLKAFLVGLLFAYIGYTLRDGIGFAQIVSISMCLCSLFSTAVLSFSKGEKYSKIYLSNFYLELSMFITGFLESVNFIDKNT